MYYFSYDQDLDSLIRYLKKNTYNKRAFDFFSTGINLKFRGKKFYVKKNKLFAVHPLQRVFVGEIFPAESGCEIRGKFKYPMVNILVYIIAFLYLLLKNFGVVLNLSLTYYEKLIISSFFLFMYLVMFLIIMTGKICYKDEESDVLNFLKNIGDKGTVLPLDIIGQQKRSSVSKGKLKWFYNITDVK